MIQPVDDPIKPGRLDGLLVTQRAEPINYFGLLQVVELFGECRYRIELSTPLTDDSMPASASEPRVDLEALHAKIGQLALENDFLRCAREGGFAGWREK